MTLFDHTLYAVLWLVFGAVHSLLARDFIKKRLQRYFGRGYRAAYNIFAAIHFVLTIVIAKVFLAPGSAVFIATPGIAWLLTALMVIGIVITIAALLHYDLGLFAGTTQLRKPPAGPTADDNGPLHITGLHRYVRHPLYTGIIVFLIGAIRTEFDVATAAWAILYILIGTYFEERSLIARYGAAYETYRQQVPAFFPWRGKIG
ncbi:MAG: isoprenylcysteine carboxylmethyltransferase family protein [Rhizobiales bacterium]|nr:isoprenylcysteine carboxylmethyltransferase family protein [Hyphomicrobiales bacterium]